MEDIYDALLELCPTFKLPGRWQTIAANPSFFILPEDNASTLAEMRRQFADADLMKSGIVTTDEAGAIIWQPSLVVDGAPIWAIRPKPDQKPTALIAQMQTVGSDKWAVCTAFEDHRQNEMIATASNQVVVAYSMLDLTILQSVGIAAIPGYEFRSLTKGQLHYLCNKLRIRFQSLQLNPYGAETSSISLIVANWSLATFEASDIVDAMTTWTHFTNLHRYLKLDFEAYGLWKPSKKNLQQLIYQLRYLKVEKIRESLLDGIEQDTPTIDSLILAKAPAARTIVEAIKAWKKAERNSMNPTGGQKAYEQLCDLLDRQCFDPLVEQALESSDPLERNSLLALAETSRLLQPQLLLLTEKVRRNVSEKGSRAGSGISKDELQTVLALSDRVISLSKGVHEWRGNKPSQKTRLIKTSAANSKPSASTRKNSLR